MASRQSARELTLAVPVAASRVCTTKCAERQQLAWREKASPLVERRNAVHRERHDRRPAARRRASGLCRAVRTGRSRTLSSTASHATSRDLHSCSCSSADDTPCRSGHHDHDAVMHVPSRPGLSLYLANVLHRHDRCRSTGTAHPHGDIVPAPIRLVVLAALRGVAALARARLSRCRRRRRSCRRSAPSSASTRLLSFLHSQRVLSSGIVARQFLHVTVRAQR